MATWFAEDTGLKLGTILEVSQTCFAEDDDRMSTRQDAIGTATGDMSQNRLSTFILPSIIKILDSESD